MSSSGMCLQYQPVRGFSLVMVQLDGVGVGVSIWTEEGGSSLTALELSRATDMLESTTMRSRVGAVDAIVTV